MKNLIFVFALLFSLTATNSLSAQKVVGKGPIVNQNLNIADFHGVHLTFSGDVYLRPGSKQSVRVEGQQNMIDILNREVEDGIWKIKFNARNVNLKDKFTVYVTVPHIDYVKLSGSGDIESDGKFTNIEDLTVAVTGSGNIKFEAECRNLSARVSGSGDITMRGVAEAANLKVTGSGDFDGYSLRTRNCEAGVTGSGDIEVHATETLIANVTGSGDIDYRGNPRVKARVTGSGDVDGHE